MVMKSLGGEGGKGWGGKNRQFYWIRVSMIWRIIEIEEVVILLEALRYA